MYNSHEFSPFDSKQVLVKHFTEQKQFFLYLFVSLFKVEQFKQELCLLIVCYVLE